MILDLGQLAGAIQVTTQFSNAVLVAMLPQVSDVARKLELPLPQPITAQQVVGSGVTPYFTWRGEIAGWGVKIQGGSMLGFHWGYFDHFETAHTFFHQQDPDEIPKFVGTVRMTKDEAIQMARDTLTKLGIPLEYVFAEQPPRVTLPPKTRTGIVPHYRVEWLDPRVNIHSVDIEINAEAKRVEYISIRYNPHLRRQWPEFGLQPIRRSRGLPVNPEYALKLLPLVLRSVDDYGKTLDLPIPRPLTTNHVFRFRVSDNGGWPHSELELTNGWRFVYRNTMVNGFYAPDNFFNSDERPISIKEFMGKENTTESKAIEIVRRALAKLNYPTNLIQMNFKPKVIKPAVPGIPRAVFCWNLETESRDDLISKVEAEIDMEKGGLKSLYFDNKALWGTGPQIDVPIALPRSESKQSEASSLKPSKAQLPPAPRKSYELPNRMK